MKWAGGIGIAVALATAWMVLDLSNRPEETGDRGLASIEFVVPGDYTVLDLGEATLQAAAEQLLLAVRAKDKIAAVFSRSGDEIQFLVDVNDDIIDERVTGRHGTLQRVFWRGSVRKRLEWAAEHGNLEVPDMPPPEKRNAYH